MIVNRLPPGRLPNSLFAFLVALGAILPGSLDADDPVSIPASPRDAVVVFNEIHYQPAGDDTSLEFVEIYNQLAIDVDLSNWRIGGIDYNIPEGTVIRGRDYLVIAKDPAALQAATGYADALGPYAGFLSNSGETLRIFTQLVGFHAAPRGRSPGEVSDSLDGRRVMDEIDFMDVYPWPSGPDGSGSSLAKIDPATGTPHPGNWAASPQQNGTPGAENTFPAGPALAFNEAAGATAQEFEIELFNPGPTAASLGGMVIASSNPDHPEFTFASQVLSSGDFLILDEATLGFKPGDNTRLFLYSIDKAALIDAVRVDDRAQARSPDGTGRWLHPDEATFGSPNSFAIPDEIVINEILYHAYPHRQDPDAPSNTPGVILLDFDANWRFEENAGSAGLPAGWDDVAHPGWPSGPGLLAQETSSLDQPINTDLDLAPPTITYYFESEFDYAGEPVDELVVEHYIDDGAVFYLNGVEIHRFNMPDGTVTPGTTASPGVADAALESFSVTSPNLVAGSNRISVEVHQSSGSSNDIVFGARVLLPSPGQSPDSDLPFAERDEEWIELYNRGDQPVDLTGWRLDGGIAYDFPADTTIPSGGFLVVAKDAAALAEKHPLATIVGDYANRLGNGGDLIVLEDPVGNPADEVVYYDSGHWHAEADGGGSSLELRHPDADNSVASSWAPSDESSRSSWRTYTYEGIAEDDGIGYDVYHEFILGMLDAGEFLLDDVSVVEDPDGANREFIQNGSFERDTLGAPPDKWRCIGTHGSHGRTVVVEDPDDPGNQCLHVVATGPTEDKHNKLETTYRNNETVLERRPYRITFRAKWLSGSNQVNTRLYFNYLQRTNLIEVPEIWGTPGAANSTLVANSGPIITGFRHEPAVPRANQPVTVSARVDDPDGLARVTLFYALNGSVFRPVTMTDTGGGLYQGTIPARTASQIIRFYLRADDSLGAASSYPPAEEKGGAFYKVDDGLADNSGLRHNLRIVMDDDDRQFLMDFTNRLSNDRFPATVIEDERTVYYDVGLRLKGSAFGRFNGSHYGFNLEFQPENRFRGVHDSISIERSPPLKELMAKHLLNRAGGAYTTFFDDVAYIINPTVGDRSVGLLSMARHTGSYFDSLFRDSPNPGTLFNHELLYNPNGPLGEALKRGNPYNHNNGMYFLEDRGDDKETYRWGFQIRSARDRDDYSKIIALNQAFDLSGSALRDAVEPLIDVDQWMRCFAMASLNGTDDITGRLYPHNFRFFVRPTDNKVICYQWDMDRSFNISSNASIPPYARNWPKLFAIPEFRRIFDGHLLDLIESTFNPTYATPWASHFTAATGHSQNGLVNYITNRANHIQGELPNDIPFRITTNGGTDFSEADTVINLEGVGWIDVFSLEVNGAPIPVTWTDSRSWSITVPIATGPNELTITAFNNRGTEVGRDTITVTNTTSVDLAHAGNTRITELHYHPATPSPAEVAAGFDDQEYFEFIEILNTSPGDIDFTGVRFTDGIEYSFPQGTILPAGEAMLLVSNRSAFELRYSEGAETIAGEFTGNLRNSGEQIVLRAADDSIIADITYGDELPWPASADGNGPSLVRRGDDMTDPLAWRPSETTGGSPGAHNVVPFTGTAADLLPYALASRPVPGIGEGTFVIEIQQRLLSDGAIVTPEFSLDLVTWVEATAVDLQARSSGGDGIETLTFGSPLPDDPAAQFARVRVDQR